MNAEILIFGGQALAGLVLIAFAARDRREKERGEGVSREKEEARGVALALLSDAWRKAKARGVCGYDRSLGFCALSECIVRLRRGDEIDGGVVEKALDLLGLAIVDDDGELVVVEI